MNERHFTWLIAILSCSAISAVIVWVWNQSRSLSFAVFIYTAVFVAYKIYRWKYRSWKLRKNRDVHLRRFLGGLSRLHLFIEILLVSIPVGALLLLAVAKYSPVLIDEGIHPFVETYQRQPVTSGLSVSSASPGNYIIVLKAGGGSAYPADKLLEDYFCASVCPAWGVVWALLLLIIVLMVGAAFAEFIGNATYRLEV